MKAIRMIEGIVTGIIVLVVGRHWTDAGNLDWLYAIMAGVALISILERIDKTLSGMAWSSLTPRRAEWKKFQEDTTETLDLVRRAGYSPDASEEDRAKAMEATMRITSSVSKLGYVVYPSSNNVDVIRRWHSLMSIIAQEMEEGGRKWYRERKQALSRDRYGRQWRRKRSWIPKRRIDAQENIDTLEAAMRCAGSRRVKHPQVQAWLARLIESVSFELQPTDAATVRTVAQWTQIIHGICGRLGEPLPSYFERAIEFGPVTVRGG